MSESWTESEDTVNIYVTVDGETHTECFPANKTVREAVQEAASKHGLSTVLVKEDEETITPSTGNRELRGVGEITVVPKNSGA